MFMKETFPSAVMTWSIVQCKIEYKIVIVLLNFKYCNKLSELISINTFGVVGLVQQLRKFCSHTSVFLTDTLMRYRGIWPKLRRNELHNLMMMILVTSS